MVQENSIVHSNMSMMFIQNLCLVGLRKFSIHDTETFAESNRYNSCPNMPKDN